MRAVGIDARRFGDGADQGAEKVDVVIGRDALHQRGDALEPHAGVDRGAGQRNALAGRDLLILHEHEVPEFKEPVAVLVGAAGRAAAQALALVVEDFRAGAAGAGLAHRPEIIAGGDADDAVVGKTGDFFPQAEGFVVVVIDGDEQLVLGQAEILDDQFPGEFDGLLLEIIAKGEIAEHFEKRVMARGIADIVEVVVLAAGAHAFLRGRRADIGRVFRRR